MEHRRRRTKTWLAGSCPKFQLAPTKHAHGLAQMLQQGLGPGMALDETGPFWRAPGHYTKGCNTKLTNFAIGCGIQCVNNAVASVPSPLHRAVR